LKKYLPYILGLLLFSAIAILVFTGDDKKAPHKFDPRITLRTKDKIPYGTYAAFTNLKYLFRNATILTSRREPGFWDSVSNYDPQQAFITITDRFGADEYEMNRLIKFAEKGNDVFISARYLSAVADEKLGCNSSAFDFSYVPVEDLQENMSISLVAPPFNSKVEFNYPGKTVNSFFTSIDSSTTDVLGVDEKGRPNFIHLSAGKGNFYVQLEPLAFSNYFILHKNNIDYYEKVISLINPATRKIVWDEYYLYKPKVSESPEKNKGWMSVLLKYPAFKAALITAICSLVLFVLLEMRRKQRYIPVVSKPRNDSLDFIKTIGRLYYDNADHKNLCRKMSAYFLEHVRTKYKLATGNLNEEFIENLQFKSGVNEEQLRKIISFINNLNENNVVTQRQLMNFYKQLETFYKKE